MIFMGSSKYPGENEYDNYVSSHGGSCNAFTESEYTNYQFEISTDYFALALDIFAHCIFSPLFSSNSVKREIESIESEFRLAKSNDANRLQQLQSSSSHDDHCAKKFSWGNLRSLSLQKDGDDDDDKNSTKPSNNSSSNKKNNTDILELLRLFHMNHYVTSKMKLVLISPEPLEDLKQKLLNTFGTFERSSSFVVDKLCTSNLPFPQSSLGSNILILI